MKSISIILTIIAVFSIINCENQIYVETGVIWSDDSYFSSNGDWYLALSEGSYSNCEGATMHVVDQLPISVNTNAVKRFVLGSGFSISR